MDLLINIGINPKKKLQTMNIYKLRNNKIDTFKEWCRYLNTIPELVGEELKHENCSREFFHIIKIEDSYYAIGHMEGQNIQKARDNKLNNMHKSTLKECFEERIEFEILYDIYQ